MSASNPQRTVDVSRDSWCGSRSAMIVMAFSMVMDERQIPVAKITRIHTDASSMADRESKLTELACDCGFTLKFH